MERLKHDQFVKSSQCTISFNSQLASLKSSLGLWEDMITKTSKLSASLKTFIQCIGGFLEAFQKIADCAYSSNCGLRELGSSMTRFCLRERGLESRLRTFNSQLNECLTAPLIDRLEEWKRTVAQLDRENGKEWRRAKSELQRATCELEKLSKRSRRKGSSVSNGVGDFDSHNEIHAFKTQQSNDSNNNSNNNNGILQSGDNMHLNFAQHDLILKQRTLAELERVSLRRAVIEERRRFAELLTCLKPVLDSKLAIFGDVNLFEESILAITHNSYDPNQIPDEIEEAIDYAVGHVTSSLTSSDRKYSTSAFGAGGGGGGGCSSSRSESRCTLRSTKQQHSGIGSSTSTTGSGLDISNQHNNNNHYYSSSVGSGGLSCHASELSLQSSISVSTNSSWNNNNISSGNSNGNNNNNNNNTASCYNNHSQSTIHASNQHCDALNSSNINNTVMPDSMSSHTHAGVGDSVSLFENPEGSISGESVSSGRPVQNSVLDSINTDWIPLPGLTNKDGNFNDRKVQQTNTAAASAAFAAAEGEYTSENGNIRDDDDVGDVDDSHDVTSGDDIADQSGGCGGGTTATTNDDTDDGETDDEKLEQSSQDLSKSRQTPMLYPNQAIPAPVYTNLNELKKAAARKFQNRQNSPTVTSTNNNSNSNNNETVSSISNSLYAGRKFSLQLNDSVITSSTPQPPPPPPSIPPIGAGNGHAEESYAVTNINKFDPNLSQSSQVIWPSIISSGKEFDGEKCYTPPASIGVVGGLTTAPLSDIITRSNNNNSNNNNKSNSNMHNSWEYDHNHAAALLNQSTYQINKSSSLLLSSQSTTTIGQLPITPSTPFASGVGVGVSVGGSTCDLLQSNVTVGGGGAGAVGSSTNDNEYITTCVNSGTSTFRRRQSEYFKKSLDCGTNPGLCPSSPPLSSSLRNSNYASIVTPGLIRRGSQAAYQQQTSHVGRLCDRPIHPPRRSSSVSREIASHNNNNMLMNNNTQISHNSNQHYSRLNLSDFAGNKNPSPFTLSHESGNNNNNFNNNSRLQSNPYMNSTPPTPPPPPPVSSSHYQQQQYQQKSLSFQQTNQNMPQQYASYRQQHQNQQCYQEPSGPLPVSSSSTSSASNVNNSQGSRLIGGSNMDGSQNGNNGNNNSQLMFGVKVLPNITPPTLLGNNPIGSQSRLPQRSLIRQASCEPLGGAGGTGNMMTTDRQTHQHYIQQQQQQQQSHYAVTGGGGGVGVGGVHSPRKNFYSHQQQQQQQGVPMMSQPSTMKSKNQSFTDDGVTSFID
ncbi:unnamed protein product [Trichobilharzia szidati]|nr:unnamed protein product [Trichobilharzia szidati]